MGLPHLLHRIAQSLAAAVNIGKDRGARLRPCRLYDMHIDFLAVVRDGHHMACANIDSRFITNTTKNI